MYPGYLGTFVAKCQFWPQVHSLNAFGRGLLDDATYQIGSSLLCFAYISLYKTREPGVDSLTTES